jgi:nicotinate-nucleotide adenylyltransferase
MPPLLLLGGTFDPPHFGHLLLAECARAQFEVPAVRFLPAGQPYRKAARKVTPAHQRLEMLRLAIDGYPAFELDDREIRRTGPTYTVDTLDELHAEGYGEILLILGSDAVAEMGAWKQPDRIRELATIVLAPKPPSPGSAVQLAGIALELQSAAGDTAALAPALKQSTRAIVRSAGRVPAAPAGMSVVDMPPLAISSTLIRERVRARKPIRYLLPDAVEEYIARHGLYQQLS